MLVLKDHQSKTVLTRQSQSFGPLSRMEQYRSMLGDKHGAEQTMLRVLCINVSWREAQDGHSHTLHKVHPQTHTLCVLSQSHTFHTVHNLCVEFILNCMLETQFHTDRNSLVQFQFHTGWIFPFNCNYSPLLVLHSRYYLTRLPTMQQGLRKIKFGQTMNLEQAAA